MLAFKTFREWTTTCKWIPPVKLTLLTLILYQKSKAWLIRLLLVIPSAGGCCRLDVCLAILLFYQLNYLSGDQTWCNFRSTGVFLMQGFLAICSVWQDYTYSSCITLTGRSLKRMDRKLGTVLCGFRRQHAGPVVVSSSTPEIVVTQQMFDRTFRTTEIDNRDAVQMFTLWQIAKRKWVPSPCTSVTRTGGIAQI